MAQTPTIAMAFASPTPSVNIPKLRDASDHSGTANYEKKATMALLTPPNSISPELAAHPVHDKAASPPAMDMEQDIDGDEAIQSSGMPLSKRALSNLDGAQTITPTMLAKHHLPGIMLGNGPRPIRYVMGELTQTVPGFSRIPPAKARRIVVAALENREGGGPDGNVEFCKTGWGRWDAHYKGSSRDSAVGSFNESRLSPPRSEYAFSYSDSAINIPGQHMPAKYKDQHSGGSWTASSIREEDEFDMEMDPLEDEADKMSMDGDSSEDDDMNDETDEEDWAAVGIDALRKASLPTPNVPRQNYRAFSQPYHGQWASKLSRHPSNNYTRPLHSTSVPLNSDFPGVQTPEEKAAIAALMSMGSM